MFKNLILIFKIGICKHFYILEKKKDDNDFIDIWIKCEKCGHKVFATFPYKNPRKYYKQIITTNFIK